MLTPREQLDLVARAEAEEEARPGFQLPLRLDLRTVMLVIANLQVAVQHPNHVGPAGDLTRGIIDAIIQCVEAEGFLALAELMRLGYEPGEQECDGMPSAPN